MGIDQDSDPPTDPISHRIEEYNPESHSNCGDSSILTVPANSKNRAPKISKIKAKNHFLGFQV